MTVTELLAVIFEVFTTVAMNVTDFLYFGRWALQRFGESICLHFKGSSYSVLRLVDGVDEDLMWPGHLEPRTCHIW